jgi:hypothetical protein
MTDLRKAAQQALECIERLNMHGWILADFEDEVEAAITALSEALAQPEQEPVAWMRPSKDGYDSAFRDNSTVIVCTGNPWTGWVPLYTTPPAAEPTCPECKAAVLYECVACSSNNYPPAAKWDKPSVSFNEWWDSNVMPPANPFAEGSAAYWAWAGWKAAQRPWVGLTEEEIDYQAKKDDHGVYFALGALWAEAKLKERNNG